ncbi:MAG: decaprenylphospho-beta-D-ribofuranose 2-oxidase [Paracoccaceae bacterium]|jgi:decaprenylphospho-beta-D-ribofuranose 2-oxidase
MRWKTAETTGWGRVLKAKADMARPEKLSTLRDSWKNGVAPAIGNLRSYGDAALNDRGRTINMTRLDRLISFDPETGILTAEAGIAIGEITRIFAPKGWIPAVLPGTGFATLGGCIANDVHGKNHAAGSFGQHVTNIELLGVNGKVRNIKPKTNRILFRATCGGLGQTGLILSATIQMIPCTSEVFLVRETRVDSLNEFLAVLESSTAQFCVGWIDAAVKGEALGRGILEEAEIGNHVHAIVQKKAKSIPKDLPRFLLAPPIVRLFNHFYLRRVPAEGRELWRAMQDFFFPLDRVHNWNRLYGKPGFHQFQCALPDATAREALPRMMDLIARSGLASPLAVLKRMGPGRAGMMSFPMEGFTLAVDFPNREKAVDLIAELEEITLNANGRLYLAKDALARPKQIAAMYDEMSDFAEVTNDLDPTQSLATDRVRRLNLRGAAK